MKYLFLICVEAPGNEPGADSVAAAGGPMPVENWVSEMDARGARLDGNRVRPASDATTVRVRNGEVVVFDGPYAETKEQIAGFDIIEAANLDEAIEIASKHEMAWMGMVDVRPYWTE
ncbi:Uncharacterized conserved protein [Asanoa hainanensis]|uniref:Uncharacterized conserved protein n=1 Tax=Asanoa hainanensis TaxID=560556 RepID=A0A239MU49_9ACTN|nr:YciI family protein [Asanoa hainanensis]SNT46266.1 Uncharacterized conserved protein [Asanoa hainanensis]